MKSSPDIDTSIVRATAREEITTQVVGRYASEWWTLGWRLWLGALNSDLHVVKIFPFSQSSVVQLGPDV